MLVNHSLIHWKDGICLVVASSCLWGWWLSLGTLFSGVAEWSWIVGTVFQTLFMFIFVATDCYFYPLRANIFYAIYCESIFQCVFRNNQQFLLRISFVSKHHLVQPSDHVSKPPLYLQIHTCMHCYHHQGSFSSEIMSYFPWLPKRSWGDRLITNNTFSEQIGT